MSLAVTHITGEGDRKASVEEVKSLIEVDLGLKRLEELGVFRNENLSEYEVSLELTRAEANEELTSVMQGYEEDDSAFWGERHHERQSSPMPMTSFSPPATANRKSGNRSNSFRPVSPASNPNAVTPKPGSVPDPAGRSQRPGNHGSRML